MRRPAGVLLAVCVLSASAAEAQTVLTLTEALTEARAGSPSLAQGRASVERAAAEVTLARAAWFPRLTFSESWQRGTSPLFAFSNLLGARRFQAADFAVDRLNHPGALSAYGSRVQVSQLLFDGGQAHAARAAASRGRDLATAELDRTDAAVALGVVRYYAQVLTAEAAERAATAAVAAADEDLRRAEQRRTAGTATDADALAIAVHLADVRQQAIRSTGDAAVARAELNRATGAPVARQFTVAEPPLPQTPPASLDDLLAEAAAKRPDVRRAIAAEEQSRQLLRTSRAAWAPTVVVRAGHDTVGLAFTDRAGSWLASADVAWSLSLGGAESARVRIAAANLSAAQAARDAAKAAVEVEVVTALRQLEAARARVVLGEQAVVSARETHRIVRNRYENGMAGVTDLLRAASAELDADRSRTRAGVDAIVAAAELRHALGRPIAAAFQ